METVWGGRITYAYPDKHTPRARDEALKLLKLHYRNWRALEGCYDVVYGTKDGEKVYLKGEPVNEKDDPEDPEEQYITVKRSGDIELEAPDGSRFVGTIQKTGTVEIGGRSIKCFSRTTEEALTMMEAAESARATGQMTLWDF